MSRFLTLVFCISLAACARSAEPLPGDSVKADGAVTLSPPRMSTSPVPAAREADPIRDRLFPPELVMEHQVDIDLTVAQRDAISREVEKLQKDMLAMQWDMQHEKEKLVKSLDAEHVDEKEANASAAKVMELENKIKSAHLSMLIHVKNALTADQQRKLATARDQERCAPSPVPSAKPLPPPPQKKAVPPPPHSSSHDVF